MPRKLPLLTERSLAQMKADRIELSKSLDAKLPFVSCKPGCSACCSYPLYVSILEGMVLYRHLTEKGLWSPSLRKKLEQHADRTFDLTAEVWFMLDLPCPLLDKGKCSAYAARPFTCRTLYARTDPKFCHPHRVVGAKYVPRDGLTAQFREAETKILARHRLSLLGMPLSRAILLGEKIVSGEIDLESFLSAAIESLNPVQP